MMTQKVKHFVCIVYDVVLQANDGSDKYFKIEILLQNVPS